MKRRKNKYYYLNEDGNIISRFINKSISNVELPRVQIEPTPQASKLLKTVAFTIAGALVLSAIIKNKK